MTLKLVESPEEQKKREAIELAFADATFTAGHLYAKEIMKHVGELPEEYLPMYGSERHATDRTMLTLRTAQLPLALIASSALNKQVVQPTVENIALLLAPILGEIVTLTTQFMQDDAARNPQNPA